MTLEVTACTPPQLAVMVAGQRVRLPPAHPSLDRIDLVVEATEHGRTSVVVLAGVPASVPSVPILTCNWSRTEVPLAQVLVRAGQVQIAQVDIHPPDADVVARARRIDEAVNRRYEAGGAVTPSFFPIMPLRLGPGQRVGTPFKRSTTSRSGTRRPPMPPRHEVVTLEAGLFTVRGWLLATIDRVLAEAVAREFDRIDPLPPEDGETP
jgi:hypothetical protein